MIVVRKTKNGKIVVNMNNVYFRVYNEKVKDFFDKLLLNEESLRIDNGFLITKNSNYIPLPYFVAQYFKMVEKKIKDGYDAFIILKFKGLPSMDEKWEEKFVANDFEYYVIVKRKFYKIFIDHVQRRLNGFIIMLNKEIMNKSSYKWQEVLKYARGHLAAIAYNTKIENLKLICMKLVADLPQTEL